MHVSYRGRGYVSGGNELEKLEVEREASINSTKIEAELKNNSFLSFLRLEIDLYLKCRERGLSYCILVFDFNMLKKKQYKLTTHKPQSVIDFENTLAKVKEKKSRENPE